MNALGGKEGEPEQGHMLHPNSKSLTAVEAIQLDYKPDEVWE